VERYDPETDSWATVAPLPAPRCCGAVATGRDGRIYVAGGFNVQGQLSAVEAYDPETDTWASVAPLPAKLAGGPATAASSNGLIYVMGGITGINTIATVRRYDPCADAWATVANMPTPRRFTDAVRGRGGQIYVLGGTVGSVGFPGTQILAVAERYDPVSEAWAPAPPLTTPRGALAAARGPGGTIFAIGGYDGSSVLNSVEAFTPGPSDLSDLSAVHSDGGAVAPRCGSGQSDAQ
jgi:N-acetylneuraminic acid mutarotase